MGWQGRGEEALHPRWVWELVLHLDYKVKSHMLTFFSQPVQRCIAGSPPGLVFESRFECGNLRQAKRM